MPKRNARWLPIAAATVTLSLLLTAVLIPPSVVSSAPVAQDEVLELDYGDTASRTLVANSASESFEAYTFEVFVPPGAWLYTWIGTDSRGGCYWEARVFEEGTQQGYASVGPAPDDWSDPAVVQVSGVAVMPGKYDWGSALVEVKASTSCNPGISYPVWVYVYFEVGSGPQPTEGPTQGPTGEPTANFWAADDYIQQGQCTDLHWHIESAARLYGGGYDGLGLGGPDGAMEVCPASTTTYELRYKVGDNWNSLYVIITVEEPTNTPTLSWPTVPPTRQPTITPQDCPDYEEPNDYPAQARVVEETHINLASYICTPDDVDYFYVLLKDHENLQVILHDLPADYDLELIDADDNTVLAASYHDGTQDEEVFWSDADGGLYLIRVSSSRGGFSNEIPYVLTIDRSASPTPTSRPTATFTPSPTPDVMKPYLVLTHIGNLNNALGGTGTWDDVNNMLRNRYGDRYRVLDFEARLGTSIYDFHQAYDAMMQDVNRLGRPNYVIIIGGPDVVPFAVHHNACFAAGSDGDEFLLSDDLYGDFAHEDWYLPEAAVARVPDGGDFNLMATIFASNNAPGSTQHDVFVLAQPYRDWSREMVLHITAGDVTHPDVGTNPLWAPPAGPSDLSPALTNARYSWYMLHGSNSDTSRWSGEDRKPNGSKTYPVAITVNEADSNGLVISSACYGAFISNQSDLNGGVIPDTPATARTASNSMALRFLQEGAVAFIGHTSSGYSLRPDISQELQNKGDFTIFIPPSNVDSGQQHFVALVFQYVSWHGWHPLDAWRQAKLEYMSTLYPGPGVPRCGEMKAQNDFVYYGLPPVR
jgi:hypothetical protein